MSMSTPLVLRAAQSCGLFALSRWLTRGQLRILCYHGIWLGPSPHYGDCLFMSAQRFRRRMALLKQGGYRVISLADGLDALRSGKVNARDVVITIDDAWAGTGLHMLPVLKAHGYPATLYVTTEAVFSQQPLLHVLLACLVDRGRNGTTPEQLLQEPGAADDMSSAQLVARLHRRLSALDTVAEREAELLRLAQLLGVDLVALRDSRAFMLMTPDEIRGAYRDGIDIQLHTHSHRMPDFDLERVRGELASNRDSIEAILGPNAGPRVHFCYPGGVYHPSLFALLEQIGVESATTTEVGLNPPGSNVYALKRILDCESFSDVELEARLSGFWMLLADARAAVRRMFSRGQRAASAAG